MRVCPAGALVPWSTMHRISNSADAAFWLLTHASEYEPAPPRLQSRGHVCGLAAHPARRTGIGSQRGGGPPPAAALCHSRQRAAIPRGPARLRGHHPGIFAGTPWRTAMRDDQKGPSEDAEITSLDAQLLELIEFVWACEVSARREARVDAAIGVGRGPESRWQPTNHTS